MYDAIDVWEALKDGPVIVLPDDRREQLQKKLDEYLGRMNEFRAPELQMENVCKVEVLKRLLKDGVVNTFELSLELASRYGSGFDSRRFDMACGVIDDYCKTGGAHTMGGTGLPSSPKSE